MRESGWSRRGFLAAMAAGTGCALAPPLLFAGPASGAQVPGWLLRDVRLVDGSGAPAKGTDVLVRGDRIERIGHVKIGRAHVCTPVTNAILVLRLSLEHINHTICTISI